jgi:AcrR family transcriptional regulator
MGDGPPQPQSGERTAREERILDAAAALLVRWGYRKTTIDDVAREAGVAKGTIYLHWRDKNELFRAAIWRELQKATEDTKQRIAADPEGGLFHRVWTHGLLAVFSNPLVAALMKGNSDVFQGLMGGFDETTLTHLMGNADEHIIQLQRAGLIRTDLPVSTITFLIGALKLGIIHAADFSGQERTPSTQELTDAISDMMGRWLEPERLPANSAAGKDIMIEWLDTANEIGTSTLRGEQEQHDGHH